MTILSELDYDLMIRRLHNDPAQACAPGCGDCGTRLLAQVHVDDDNPPCGWCSHPIGAHQGKPFHVGGVVVGNSTCARLQAANPGKTGCPDCLAVAHGRKACDSDFPDSGIPTGHRHPAIRFRAPSADKPTPEA